MIKYIENIDSAKAGLASVGAATTGQLSGMIELTNLEVINIMFQHAVWTIAIIAGIISIINGVRKWDMFNKDKEEEDEDVYDIS